MPGATMFARAIAEIAAAQRPIQSTRFALISFI
jgi:hypothetical protein